MPRIMINRNRYYLLFGLYLAMTLISPTVHAQVVDDVVVKPGSEGWDIEIKFIIPLRYHSHSPKKSGKTLEIQLRAENFANPELTDRLNERANLSWNKKAGLPVSEILFDGEEPGRPQLLFQFTRNVEFIVRNSADLRAIIISIKAPEVPKTTTKKHEIPAPVVTPQNLVTALTKLDPKLSELLERANQAMLDKDYSRAVQLFTKIREASNREMRQHVQELLGVAREYNGQLAHAKAEYLQYLKDYPDGKDSERVKQRLTAIITAAETPTQKLRVGRRQQALEGKEWDTQFYGSFSQIYYRDETTPEDEETLLIRSDLSTDLDFVGRARKGDYDLRTQFIGSYREDLRTENDEGGEFIPSILSLEGRHSGKGIFAKLGRQSRTTGGVLGRFDGFHAAYEWKPTLTINTVYGYPVDTTDKTKINSDQEFYGVSLDVGTLWDGWDFNSFYISQDNAGIKDREAIGGEARYFDSRKSLFTLLDYDVFYSELNIFLLIANWTVAESTTLNLVTDVRNSPTISTTNAIQGQGVQTLDELANMFSEDELRQLARDRTADSKSITTGITQQLNENLQFIGELTISEFGETVASGGVEAIPGTGKEYFYSAQLVANNLVYDNDIAILGLRYYDTVNADTYSVDANWRVNINNKTRVNPRMRVDYRKEKVGYDSRWLARPFIRADYRLKKWMKLEMDLGYEWVDEEISRESRKTTGYFLSAGYRVQF